MRKAYQESRLNEVQNLLGEYFDIAVNGYHLSLETAISKLLVSKYSKLIERGNVSIIYGKSGYELFYDVMIETTDSNFIKKEINLSNSSIEFWIGWIYAYFQWYTSRSFDNINHYLPIDKVKELYHPYHEMDERSFSEDVKKQYFEKTTNLKFFRKSNKLTQSELAKKANVSIRTIQMLEQRQNDINQTKAINLFNLSRVLDCTMEDLLE